MADITQDIFIDCEDNLIFSPAEDPVEAEHINREYWKVMIVDDEREIHDITRMVLEDFEFEGKSLTLLNAYSGQEANRLIAENPDTALILLDVVMEKDDAGLKTVRYIREELQNHKVRIVLRTGQPGQAPEKKVIVNYDINDYREKTELTSQKLFTTVTSSLRSYRDIMALEANKRGLERVITTSAEIFELQNMRRFLAGALNQLLFILQLPENTQAPEVSGFVAMKSSDAIFVSAAVGCYKRCIDADIRESVSGTALSRLEEALRQKENVYSDRDFALYFHSKSGAEGVIYLEGLKRPCELDRYLIEVFCGNLSTAFDNILLNEEIVSTQKEVIFTLGEIIEGRSKETASHVKRVAELSKFLALKYGLSEKEAEIIRLASPMHDIGKLGIPDAILQKPGSLTFEELEVIKTHSVIGYEMLKHSNRDIMKAAAIIALQHHEKYNGSGYPCGLKGEDIHIYARITAVADVFDALITERIYKEAWDVSRILVLFKEGKGEHFDPLLTDILLNNLEEVVRIKESFPDI